MRKFYLVFLFLNVNGKEERTFRWKKDALLVPSERWNEPGIEKLCARDTLEFSASEPTSILATSSFSFGTLKLPTNGELILGDNVQFGTSDKINDCSESRQLSYSSVADEWYEIENWEAPAVSTDQLVLDEEKVPCQTDAVIFEPISTFMVQGLAAVKQIDVAQQKIDSGASFFDYKQNTRSGEYQFQHLDVKFHPSCPVSGCPCHPGEVGPVLERLCETVSCSNSSDSSSEEELPCSSPFVPDGSCCATCGARIKIEFNEMMNFDELSKLVYESVSQDYGDNTIRTSISNQMKKDEDQLQRGSKEFIQIFFVDNEGDGKAAKAEAARIEKILKTFPGVESLETENSGKTGALSGGAIFGIIFAIIFASAAGFFIFIKKDSLFISRSVDFSNPVHSEGDVDLSEIGAAGRQTSEVHPAAPKTGKKRAPLPKLEASAETVIALETEQFKHVDSKFGTSAEGVINVNFEELQEERNFEEVDNENEPAIEDILDLDRDKNNVNEIENVTND